MRMLLILSILLLFVYNMSEGSEDIKRKIKMLSSGGSIRPEVFLAMAKVESSFKPGAKGDWHCEKKIKDVCIIRKFKAHGLFQIHRPAATDAGFYGSSELLFDPSVNTTVAIFYLYGLYNKLDGNLWCAVSAYNRGRRRIGAKTNCDNHDYVKKVKTALKDLTKGKISIKKAFQI